MKYTVSISYLTFDFDDLSDACTFCKMARRSNLDVNIELTFNFEEEKNDEEN